MRGTTRTLGRALISGSVASVVSSVALAVAARAEGKGALQPVNATSHWRHGEGAGKATAADLAHTGVGYATHHAATVFWAVLFEAINGRRRPAVGAVLHNALVTSAIAAVVDYGATPRRFTPGWELVLSKRAMALVYAAMAVGLAAGARWSGNRR